MKKIFSSVLYIAAALCIAGCAKTVVTGPNEANERYFDAWMQLNYPNLTAQGLGYYVVEETAGNGVEVEEDGFVLVDYRILDLQGNISSYTDAQAAKQLGKYNASAYYGPKFWTTAKTTLPAGLFSAMIGQKAGTSRKIIIPSWLMTYKDYGTEEDDYLNPELGKDEEYDASSYSNTMYEFTITDFTEDVNQWQIDSIGRFFKNSDVKLYGTPASTVFAGTDAQKDTILVNGFYYKQITAPVDTASFPKDTTLYIRYTGKLINGLVFDTNIERVAKDNGLYSATSAYEPMQVNWGEKYEDLTLGSDKSSMITGFALTLWQMKSMEKGVGVFYSPLGYGTTGSGESIPGYAPLIFEIEFVEKPE